ncbi:MAG: TlpA family protein disulfide reductase [Gemmatimonadaceae bacterium]|nr:TlpA family protein disulfide reductase [Gemmatimonadaceae bacterium]
MSSFHRLLRWRHWSTLMVVAISLWALPRLLPHVGALVGIRSRDASIPTFTVHTLSGATLSTDSLRGKVVLVNVWATWCIPCRAEMPLLESTWKRHRDAGLVLLGASVDRGDPAIVREFVASRGITYPISIVSGEVIAALGGVQGYPTSVLIGRDGRVRHRVMGPIGPVSLEPAIRKALSEPAGTTPAGQPRS